MTVSFERQNEFYRYFFAQVKAGQTRPIDGVLDVLARDLEVFADREISGINRLLAADRITGLLPEEVDELAFNPESMMDALSKEVEEHPRYAFDQDAMGIIFRTTLALGIGAGFRYEPIDMAVRSMGRFGSTPRKLARIGFEDAYQAACGGYAGLRDPLAEMGAQADVVPKGIRITRALRQIF
jgi:hypothetical protein